MNKEIGDKLPRLMSIRQFAALGVLSEYATRLLVKRGKLPCVRINRKVLISVSEALRMLERGGAGDAAKD